MNERTLKIMLAFLSNPHLTRLMLEENDFNKSMTRIIFDGIHFAQIVDRVILETYENEDKK